MYRVFEQKHTKCLKSPLCRICFEDILNKNKYKGGNIITTKKELPITQKQFEDSILNFIYNYKRLPYIDGDDVEVKVKNDDGEVEPKPYRANRYINEFYGSQDNCTEELFKKGLVTYQQIADLYDYTETLIKNAYEGTTQNPQIGVRRALHIFFNTDLYEGRLDKHHSLCMDCKRRCKQGYWVGLTCGRYNKKIKNA